jgi:hypothetical protein
LEAVTELPPVRYCAMPGCGQPVETMTCDQHDWDNDEHGRPVVVSVIVTNQPCGHALITTPDKQGDALQRPA